MSITVLWYCLVQQFLVDTLYHPEPRRVWKSGLSQTQPLQRTLDEAQTTQDRKIGSVTITIKKYPLIEHTCTCTCMYHRLRILHVTLGLLLPSCAGQAWSWVRTFMAASIQTYVIICASYRSVSIMLKSRDKRPWNTTVSIYVHVHVRKCMISGSIFTIEEQKWWLPKNSVRKRGFFWGGGGGKDYCI
jgi:hypothetical protein